MTPLRVARLLTLPKRPWQNQGKVLASIMKWPTWVVGISYFKQCDEWRMEISEVVEMVGRHVSSHVRLVR